MPNEKNLQLWKYDISEKRYNELKYFCRQYKEWKSKTKYGLSAINNDGMPHARSISNPTEQQAIRNEKFLANIVTVEVTCQEADNEIWQYILRNVAYGETYEYMNPPCGRRQFYQARRRFFYILDLKRP